jgi:hypothetical protein
MRHPLCTGQAARITKAANSADGLTVVVAQRWCTRLALLDLSSAVSCCAWQCGEWCLSDEVEAVGGAQDAGGAAVEDVGVGLAGTASVPTMPPTWVARLTAHCHVRPPFLVLGQGFLVGLPARRAVQM